MFNSKEAKTDKGFSENKFIEVGPSEIRINEFKFVTSKKGDRYKIEANVETKPIGNGFEGWEGAKGKIGRFDFSSYILIGDKVNNDDGTERDATPEELKMKEKQEQWVVDRLASIAVAMGVKPQLDGVTASKISEYVQKAFALIKGKYAWFLIGGEEWESKEGKIKTSLRLPLNGYVAATELELKAKHPKGMPDKDTTWFFKRLVKMDNEKARNKIVDNIPEGEDDLPF